MILGEHSTAPYHYRRGAGALIVSMPHVGTYVPPSIGGSICEVAACRPDTDWHLPRLYDFLDDLGASVLVATHSRYVIDLNRPPDDANLYPGQDTTGLIPLDTFAKQPLYLNAMPTKEEVARRVERYWKPYHRRLQHEVTRVKAEHGRAILWDAHSIVSVAPRFFEGRLPDFNLGTASGTSCDPNLARALLEIARSDAGYTAVLDGRFKGGYITRHYGAPADNVHAVQLEMAESVYMEERSPYPFRADLAARARPILREMLALAAGWAE